VLSGGSFDGADFRDADMRRTMIGGVDLSEARGLTQEQIDDACADSRTRLPAGLTAKNCHGGVRVIVKPHVPRPPAPPAPPEGPRYIISIVP